MKSREFIRELQRNGWYVVRQSGSHVIMRHDLKNYPISVPNHGAKEMAKGLEISLRKQAGLYGKD